MGSFGQLQTPCTTPCEACTRKLRPQPPRAAQLPDGSVLDCHRHTVFVGEAMARESVGIEFVDDDVWHLHLGPMRLGVVHA